MNEILTPDDTPSVLAARRAAGARMDSLRRTMDSSAHLVCYLLQGDQILAAGEETGHYFEMLAEWNRLWREHFPEDLEQGDDGAN